jgi:NACHT domain
MRTRGASLRPVGWLLLGVGLLAFSIAFVLRSAGAHDPDQFNRLVGWANILGCVLAAAGLAMTAMDRSAVGRRPDTSDPALRVVEGQLAAVVLGEESTQRARLLGTDEHTEAINVGFYRDMVRYRPAGGGAQGQLDTVLAYYAGLSPGRFVILGEPGSGKTVLALHLLVQILEEHEAGRPAADGRPWQVPIRLSLAAFDTSLTLEQWLTAQLTQRYALAEPVADALVRRRRILPILDGLDEMDPDNGIPRRAIEAVERINAYVRGQAASPVVVTCRRHRYQQLADAQSRPAPATDVYIEELDAVRISRYLRDQLRGPDDEEAWKPILEHLSGPASPTTAAIVAALGTPWRLTLAVLVVRDGTAPAVLLTAITTPGDNGIADPLLDLLLTRFIPAATRLHPDPRYSDPEKVTHWLTALAEHLRWQARQQGGSPTDLVPHDLWKITHDNRPRDWHAAVAVVLCLTAAALVARANAGPVDLWLGNIRYFFSDFSRLPRDFRVGGLLMVVSLTIAAPLLAMRAWSNPVRPTQLNFSLFRTAQGRRRLASGLAVGLLLGLCGGLVLGAVTATGIGTAAGFKVGAVLGLVTGLVFGLVTALDTGIAAATHPLDPLRSSMRSGPSAAIAFGLVLGLAAGLGARLQLSTSPEWAVAAGLALGITAEITVGLGLGEGGALALRHVAAVVIGRSRGDLPPRPGLFLDWAYDAGILRIAGLAYQFRHQQLLEWLAPAEPAPQPEVGIGAP